MQCISYDIERVGFAEFTATHPAPITFSAIGFGGVSFEAEAVGRTTFVAIPGNRATFTAERVCSFFPGAALGVTPDVVWLNESNDYTAYFEVSSNVDWSIH
jgi:hypothetical protein